MNTPKRNFSFFSSGLFFLPYLILYLLFWVFGLKVKALVWLFWILNLVNLTRLLAAYWRFERRDKLFYGGLGVLIFWAGVYLEYPSDVWGHLRDILHWETVDFIKHSESSAKSGFFFGYSVIGWVPFSLRTVALDLYASFWQILVLYQVERLARAFGFPQRWAKIQVLSFFMLFGTNLFGLRHYAISTLPLAYCAYFEGLITLLQWDKLVTHERRKKLFFLLLISGFNHFQEFLFLGGAILLYFVWNRWRKLSRVKFWAGLTVLSAVTFWAVASPLTYGRFCRKILSHLIPAHFLDSSRFETSLEALTFSRFFPVFRQGFSYFETFGVHGFLGILAALFLWRRRPTFALASLLPFFLCFFTPLVIAFISVRGIYIGYRVLFSFPTCLALAVGLCELSDRFLGLRRPWLNSVLVIGVLAALAWPHNSPWRGRLWFQLYKPGPILSLEFLDPLVNWFKDKPKNPDDCPLASDHLGAGVLWAHANFYYYDTPGRVDRKYLFSTPFSDKRRDPISFWHAIADEKTFLDRREYYRICQFLLVDRQKYRELVPADVISEVPRSAKHWRGDYFAVTAPLPDNIYEYVRRLESLGWRKEFVPPFYELWSSPSVP